MRLELTLHTEGQHRTIVYTKLFFNDAGFLDSTESLATFDTESIEFYIECAIYGVNEGQVDSDTIEDDDGNIVCSWKFIGE